MSRIPERATPARRTWTWALPWMAALALALPSAPARAWDPSTTHATMTKRAVTASAMHVRWMDDSDLQRGVFSPLRLDPATLPEDMQRQIVRALRSAHAAGGAAGLGGPGACPGASAPLPTRALCVKGDQWELSALGWIQLGMLAEVDPRDRLLHHFADRQDPSALTWADRSLPRAVLRAEHRRNGASVSEAMAGTAFAGKAPSVAAWLDDPADPLAPRQALAQLRQASVAETAKARDGAMALGLMGIGALLHVVQDVGVPAHARGDITAFFSPLSRTTGDRGLPLQEFVRVEYGTHGLPQALGLDPRQTTRGVLLSETLRGHVVGDDDFEGIVARAGHRFLSETSLPEPMHLPPDATAEEAAAALLADSDLDPVELQGAKLSPWPEPEGYVVSGGGRPLAAFEVDAVGQVRLFVDRRVYRDQAGHLIPFGVEVSRSLIDLLLPAFPEADRVEGSDVLALNLADWPYEAPVLHVMVEDRAGRRTTAKRVKLRAGQRNRVAGAIVTVPEDARVVLVVEATSDGLPITAERVWVDRPDAPPKTPTPTPTTEPGADEPTDDEAPDADAPDADAPDLETPTAEPDPAPAKAPEDTDAPAAPGKVPEGVAPPSSPKTPSGATGRGPAIPTKRESED